MLGDGIGAAEQSVKSERATTAEANEPNVAPQTAFLAKRSEAVKPARRKRRRVAKALCVWVVFGLVLGCS